jgi:hypothetical protein
MTIEAKLSKSQFIRLTILHHIQRKQFYFYALTAALVTVAAIVMAYYALLVVVWLPFFLYLAIGIIDAYRAGNDEFNPALHPTTYKFSDKGIKVTNGQDSSHISWNQISTWSTLARIYVLTLKSGPILAIPQTAVATPQTAKFRAILNKHIKQ